MTKEEMNAERRKQRRLAQLGTNNPICLICGHTKWTGFQYHHIAGQHYHKFGWYFCSTCHDDFSAEQRALPPPANKKTPSLSYIAGRFLVGLADIFEQTARAIERGAANPSTDIRLRNQKAETPENTPYMTELARFLAALAPVCRELGLRLIAEDGKQSGPGISNEK